MSNAPTIPDASPAASRIPPALSTFVGRRREMDELGALLDANRLMTLTGAAGGGKTRLAAEVARARSEMHEVLWIELGPLQDGSLVAGQIAAMLGMRQQSGVDVTDTLIATIADRPLLIVLDNCEHVIDACAAVADRLLQQCPRLRMIVTSRQPLGVAGERSWAVPPLALPPPDPPSVQDALTSEAVQLFVQRAADATSEFALTTANVDAVVRICRRLDGLPLAIELAAARVTMLAPEQLMSRLDDVFAILTSRSRTALPRHRTLRALLDWSYDLLEPDERRFLRRLAVFAGGFTLDAAEAVPALDDLAPAAILDLLAALVERSLVVMCEQHGEARYTLLETVRQYAHARAATDETGDERALIAGRHARYYGRLAVGLDDALHGQQQLVTLARFEAEHDNFRAALTWSIAQNDALLALQLCIALRDFWALRGHITEARRWIGQALHITDAEPGLTARAITAGGRFARLQGEHDVARAQHVRAVDIARRSGDRLALAEALTNLGAELALARDLAAAQPALDEAVAIHRALGSARALSHALTTRSAVALTSGDLELARSLRTEAAEVSRRAGDREGEARALIGLGEEARLAGDITGARTYNERAITLFRELGDTWHVAAALQNLGWIATASGDLDAALSSFAESFELFVRVGNRAIGAALCLAGLAPLLHARGQGAVAARALGNAQRTFGAVAIRPAAADQKQWDDTRDALRTALGTDAFERAWLEDLPGDAVDIAASLLAELRAPAAPAAAPVPDVPRANPRAHVRAHVTPDLRVLALGPLIVLRAGEPMRSEHWGSARPRELLVYLLCWPRGRTREQIGLAFWPDATAAQVSNSFHVLLYRLRKALGRPEWITLVDDRYRIAPDVNVEFDVVEFESGMTRALRGGSDIAELESALLLYRGEFLEEEEAGSWSSDVRDRMRRLYLNGLLALGEHHFAHARFEPAADAFRRIIERDDLHEAAYRGLMQSLARTGSRTEALRLFQRLSELLRDELDTSPERETLGVFRLLQSLDAG